MKCSPPTHGLEAMSENLKCFLIGQTVALSAPKPHKFLLWPTPVFSPDYAVLFFVFFTLDPCSNRNLFIQALHISPVWERWGTSAQTVQTKNDTHSLVFLLLLSDDELSLSPGRKLWQCQVLQIIVSSKLQMGLLVLQGSQMLLLLCECGLCFVYELCENDLTVQTWWLLLQHWWRFYAVQVSDTPLGRRLLAVALTDECYVFRLCLKLRSVGVNSCVCV